MIRILHSVSNMDRAGIETILMNFYRNIDRERIQFDFLSNKPKPGDYDNEIIEMGGKLFVAPGFMSYRKYVSYMTELFKKHKEYKIIHAHNGPLMAYALRSAQKNNIPVRIAHAHATGIPLDATIGMKIFMKSMLKHLATDYWGCSNAAGEFFFSKKYWNRKHELIHNAVDVEAFTFNEAARRKIREQFRLGDKFVLGHIGRLAWVKNHKRLIEIFNVIHKIEPASQLVIIGIGELEDALKKQVAEAGLVDAVTFTGVQSNVDEWYSAFDAFVMPSWKEGLPVVGIEAQAADLPCIFSDTITTEVKATDKVRFMSLDEAPEAWATEILKLRSQSRGSSFDALKRAGYDVKTEALRLQKLYLDMYERAKEI